MEWIRAMISSKIVFSRRWRSRLHVSSRAARPCASAGLPSAGADASSGVPTRPAALIGNQREGATPESMAVFPSLQCPSGLQPTLRSSLMSSSRSGEDPVLVDQRRKVAIVPGYEVEIILQVRVWTVGPETDIAQPPRSAIRKLKTMPTPASCLKETSSRCGWG